MATWPATLPKTPLLSGFDRSRPDPVARTSVVGGRTKNRLLYAAVPTDYSVSFIFDKTELETFYDFFEDEVNFGATVFEWEDPISKEVGPFRFTSVPRDFPVGLKFRVQFNVEKLP